MMNTEKEFRQQILFSKMQKIVEKSVAIIFYTNTAL